MLNKQQNGFTLIELSLVLVIIGLIVGGVLVGKDLINAATIRSQISQLESFDMGVSVFKQKYGALPGDIRNPQDFGLAYDATTDAYCNTNNVYGNGIIQDQTGVYPIVWTACEQYYFFLHLKDANLIKDLPQKWLGLFSYGCTAIAGVYPQTIDCQYPAAKLGTGGFIATSLSDGSLAYFLGVTNKDPSLSNPYRMIDISTGAVITPTEAYKLDTKLDDGKPLSGKIKSAILPATADTVADNCLTSVANNTYNLTKSTVACNLLIKSSGN